MTSEKAYDVEQRFNAHMGNHFSGVGGTAVSLTSSMQTIMSLDLIQVGSLYVMTGLLAINSITSGGTLHYRLHPTGGLTQSGTFRGIWLEFQPTSIGAGGTEGFDATLDGSLIGSGLADRFVRFDATMTVATPGTMNVQASLTGGGAATSYSAGSHFECWVVT
jgi:hypothetical protein